LALALSIQGADRAEYWTFATRRTLECGSHFGQVEPELGHRSAQRISMHAQLFGCLTLVSPVRYQNFSQILPLELANGFVIAKPA
jgi:hypothetical protein